MRASLLFLTSGIKLNQSFKVICCYNPLLDTNHSFPSCISPLLFLTFVQIDECSFYIFSYIFLINLAIFMIQFKSITMVAFLVIFKGRQSIAADLIIYLSNGFVPSVFCCYVIYTLG